MSSQIIDRNIRNDPSAISCNQTVSSCSINCNVGQSCFNNTILCPIGSNSECNINCNGGNGRRSCANTEIIYDDIASNISLVIYCNGIESCVNMTINAPPKSNVTIYCSDDNIADKECASMVIDAVDANFVMISCNGDCHDMDIFCPPFIDINGNKNCEINCLNATDCRNNEIFIYEPNLNYKDEIGLSYLCSFNQDLCTDSIINCYESNGEYLESCKWEKVRIQNKDEWNCNLDDPCHGKQAVEFLSGWNSPSTVVFVLFMAFGCIIIVAIFIWSMKEKYDEYQTRKEKTRKKKKRDKSKQKNERRKESVLGINREKRIYSKGHKLSGSYYKAPKSKKQHNDQEDSLRMKRHKKSTIDEESEYQYDPNHPSNIQILQEADSYLDEIDDDDISIIEEEEESSISIQSNYSTKSAVKSPKNTKANKKVKQPNPIEPVLSFSSISKKFNDYDDNNNSSSKTKKKKDKNKGKTKKKKDMVHSSTPINAKRKLDQDPPSLKILSFDEDKSYDDQQERTEEIMQIKRAKKKKTKFSIDSFSPRKKAKKSISKEEYESDDSNASNQSIKSSKSPKQKRSVRFSSETLNQQKNSKSNKKKKKKTRSASKPLNIIDEDKDGINISKPEKLKQSKSLEQFKRSNKDKTKDTKDKRASSTTMRKKKKDKTRKKSAPINKINNDNTSTKLHRKTNSLISLGGMFGKKDRDKPKLEDNDSGSSTIQQSTKLFSYFSKKDGNGHEGEEEEEEEEEKLPSFKRERSSPLFTKQISDVNFSEFMWDTFYASQVYGGALFHAFDIATDFGVIVNWIENDQALNLIILSFISVFLYRFLSAIILSRQFGWQWGIIQFLDLTIYIEAYRSLKNPWCQYTRELKWIRRMEAVFESTPQALLQLGFLLKSSDFITNNYSENQVQSFDILIILSFISSLLSIAFSIARDDEAHFNLDTFAFMVPYFRSREKKNKWYKENVKPKKKSKKKKKNKKSQQQQQQQQKQQQQAKQPWLAMYELKACYEETESYVQDVENTIWLPNWKYIIRFIFRFCEITARILTLTLFWTAFGGLNLLYLLSSSLFLYLCLQITGIIGYEWGNMWTFVIVHPNLTLKTDFSKSDRPIFLKIITIISGWYLLHKIFKLDMVYTHFIHRFIETMIELVIISVSMYGTNCCGVIEKDRFRNDYNTRNIFDESIGFGLIITAYLCTIITPILYKFIIVEWIKKGTSLENNLFGIIRLFDTNGVENFLKKSNRSEQLINSLSPQGYTPLSLACDIGFYDIFEILIKYGADINCINKKGETALFIFAKTGYKTASKKRINMGLNKLKKLGADFSIIDKQGWSAAFHACENGNIKFIDWLCNNDMSDALQARDYDKRTIAHIASVHNQFTFLQTLDKLRKKKKLKINLLLQKDDEKKIPLHYAFEHQSAESVNYLIKFKRESLDYQDINGDTPINFGARFGEITFFNKLKQLGYKKFRIFLNPVAIEDDTGDTMKWLLRECQGSSGNILKPLNKFKDEHKRNPVHYAAMYDHYKLIPLLNKYKFPMNETDYKHRTPAFFAAQRGHIKCLKELHKLGANFAIQNNKRLSPLDIAKQNQHLRCVEFLQDFLK